MRLGIRIGRNSPVLPAVGKGGFDEGRHPRDGNGRFSETGGVEKRESTVKKLNPDELKGFIKESMEDRQSPHRQFKIGTVSDEAGKRIETVCGRKVKDIEISNQGIVHALKKHEHNLEAEDLLLAVDVINTTADIELSDKKHLQSNVLTFRKDIGGNITFLAEVKAKNGYLLVFNAWRQKKARNRRCPNADRNPQGTYAQNESAPDEPISVSPSGIKKSSSGIVRRRGQGQVRLHGDREHIAVRLGIRIGRNSPVLPAVRKGGFDEGRHPRDGNGRFSETGGGSLVFSSAGATRQKAIDALDALLGRELVNTETGIRARISGEQRNKVVSNAAQLKSQLNGFTSGQHFAVAACIDGVWKKASLVESRDDLNGDPNIVSIKRFSAPIVLDGEPAAAYITAKESVEHGHRIYSLELTEIKNPVVNKGGTLSGNKGKRTTPHGQPLAGNGKNHLSPTVSPSGIKKSSSGIVRRRGQGQVRLHGDREHIAVRLGIRIGRNSPVLPAVGKGGFDEGRHPRDGNGRFSETGGGVYELKEKSVLSKEEQKGISALKRLADGENIVKDAMHRPELEEMGGYSGIAFYWGEPGRTKPGGHYRGGYGFQKILEKHGIEDAVKVVTTIANGKVGKPYGAEHGRRVDIVNADHQTTISLYKDGKSESWVLTGFTIDKGTDAKGRGGNLAPATQNSPTFTRADLGAVISSLSPSGIKKSSGRRLGIRKSGFTIRGDT